MLRKTLGFGMLLFLAVLLIVPARSQDAARQTPAASNLEDLGSHVLGEAEVAAELASGQSRERITGTISVYLSVTPKGLAAGRVLVRAINLVFTGVNQGLLAPEAKDKATLGVLAFAVNAGTPQTLKYDARTGQISGELRMYADARFLAAYPQPTQDAKGDVFTTPTIPVTAAIQFSLDKQIPEKASLNESRLAKVAIRLTGGSFSYDKLRTSAFELRLHELVHVDFKFFPVVWFEVAQALCVQPVRLLRIDWNYFGQWPNFNIQLSGTGLAFGQPGARAEWAKANVVFTFRDWKTIWADNYWELTSGEASGLRAKVDDADCVEVFFPHDFDPDAMWGGGATFGSGTATAKIISTDGNARGGVDFTHLAHELGHVLNLGHPAGIAGLATPSTGTLMCPSGYLNDNPRVNSQENANLISNPLLTFAIKRIGPGPDCINSADCGPCPAIP